MALSTIGAALQQSQQGWVMSKIEPCMWGEDRLWAQGVKQPPVSLPFTEPRKHQRLLEASGEGDAQLWVFAHIAQPTAPSGAGCQVVGEGHGNKAELSIHPSPALPCTSTAMLPVSALDTKALGGDTNTTTATKPHTERPHSHPIALPSPSAGSPSLLHRTQRAVLPSNALPFTTGTTRAADEKPRHLAAEDGKS